MPEPTSLTDAYTFTAPHTHDDLYVQVRAGSSLLIMGPSGAGKTSLLRALAGLWSDGRGAITVGAAKEDIMFLPQRPYMVLGSLRDQALYPRWAAAGVPHSSAASSQEPVPIVGVSVSC